MSKDISKIPPQLRADLALGRLTGGMLADVADAVIELQGMAAPAPVASNTHRDKPPTISLVAVEIGTKGGKVELAPGATHTDQCCRIEVTAGTDIVPYSTVIARLNFSAEYAETPVAIAQAQGRVPRTDFVKPIVVPVTVEQVTRAGCDLILLEELHAGEKLVIGVVVSPMSKTEKLS